MSFGQPVSSSTRGDVADTNMVIEGYDTKRDLAESTNSSSGYWNVDYNSYYPKGHK